MAYDVQPDLMVILQLRALLLENIQQNLKLHGIVTHERLKRRII